MERLQKFIANSGYCSRRKAEELISKGQVYVNGEMVTELGTKVSGNETIVVEGVTLGKQTRKEYYLLNKPRGYICSVSDDKGRKVVTDLINTNERIYPVGRLDYDTTGVLLLTNDGDFANILMHPSNEVEKTYVAKLEGDLGFGKPVAENSAGAGVDGVHSASYKKQNPDWVLTLTYVEETDVLTISINTDIDSLSDTS